MTIDEAIKHCEEVADVCEFEASKYDMTDPYENSVAAQEGECANKHRQLAEWLKCLAKISDMLDGTIDHLSGDDAKELLSDVKWELKLAKLIEL